MTTNTYDCPKYICQCHILDGEDLRERDDLEFREGLFKLCLELILGLSLHGSGIRPHH